MDTNSGRGIYDYLLTLVLLQTGFIPSVEYKGRMILNIIESKEIESLSLHSLSPYKEILIFNGDWGCRSHSLSLF